MRTILTLVVGALLTAGLTGCGDDGGSAGPTVVAGFYPLAEAAGRVVGDGVEVVNLTPPGVEPHDLELTTDQADAIEDADLVVLLGGDFQPSLEDAAERRDGDTVFVLEALGVDAAGDPHVWLDPVRMAELATVVAAAVADAFPDDRDAVENRQAAYRDEIDAVHERYAATLTGCERDTFVTAHAAFGHLAERYGLRQEAIAGFSPEQEPDPRRLDQLADLVEDLGITTVFTEELVSPAVAETLAREVGVETDVLDPLESLGDPDDDYVSVMERNLDRLAAALGCPQ